jgi:pyruvate/2-oxoglutarate dehydrogenase complex dihydrolipoamide dehydrogenase (E3) component
MIADTWNDQLLRSVRPAGWKNPEPASCYNLVVIGAGTAGLVAAAGAAGLGARVALVEHALFGGDCLNFGCVPSKALIRSARALHDVRQAKNFGVRGTDGAFIDFSAAMERMRSLRAGLSARDSVQRFSRDLGVDVFLGQARFIGKDSIAVDESVLKFSRAAICTGSRPVIPSIPGIETINCLTNETVFELPVLPKRLIVIGGGPQGCELSQAFSRMGSSVTLIQQGAQLLPNEDDDAALLVKQTLERDGVTVFLNASVTRAERQGSDKILSVEHAGRTVTVAADEVLAATGRTPNITGLDLAVAGIDADPERGVQVDDRLRTANPRVYAAGDVCASHRFTHAADAMARIVIENALFFGRKRVSSLVIPRCTFTDPEVAVVGLTQAEARSRSIAVRPFIVSVADLDRARLDNEPEGFCKVLLPKRGDAILGATIVARNAGDLLSPFTIAMTNRIELSAVGKTIFPYPTQAELAKKAADVWNRTRLTPRMKRLFRAWFRLRRS